MDRQQERTWLDVPFERNKRRQGTRCPVGPGSAQLVRTAAGMTSLTRWERLPEVLPGEDRSFGSRAVHRHDPLAHPGSRTSARPSTPRLAPAPHHGLPPGRSPLRSLRLPAAQSIGEVPGGTRTIRLRRRDPGPGTTAADLPVHRCHTVTHFGLAQARGEAGRARAWLADRPEHVPMAIRRAHPRGVRGLGSTQPDRMDPGPHGDHQRGNRRAPTRARGRPPWPPRFS